MKLLYEALALILLMGGALTNVVLAVFLLTPVPEWAAISIGDLDFFLRIAPVFGAIALVLILALAFGPRKKE